VQLPTAANSLAEPAASMTHGKVHDVEGPLVRLLTASQHARVLIWHSRTLMRHSAETPYSGLAWVVRRADGVHTDCSLA
jgi:hypothetical protein